MLIKIPCDKRDIAPFTIVDEHYLEYHSVDRSWLYAAKMQLVSVSRVKIHNLGDQVHDTHTDK